MAELVCPHCSGEFSHEEMVGFKVRRANKQREASLKEEFMENSGCKKRESMATGITLMLLFLILLAALVLGLSLPNDYLDWVVGGFVVSMILVAVLRIVIQIIVQRKSENDWFNYKKWHLVSGD